jgi:hypothetical protein
VRNLLFGQIATEGCLCGVPATGKVVAISPVMAFGAMIVLIAWTRRYMLAVRERRIREQQLSRANNLAMLL